MRIYPIFTDGKKFYHSDEFSPPNCRMAYFSKLKLKDWLKEKKPTLTKEKAKSTYDSWDREDKENSIK